MCVYIYLYIRTYIYVSMYVCLYIVILKTYFRKVLFGKFLREKGILKKFCIHHSILKIMKKNLCLKKLWIM